MATPSPNLSVQTPGRFKGLLLREAGERRERGKEGKGSEQGNRPLRKFLDFPLITARTNKLPVVITNTPIRSCCSLIIYLCFFVLLSLSYVFVFFCCRFHFVMVTICSKMSPPEIPGRVFLAGYT